MKDVAVLSPQEVLRQDMAAIAEIYHHLGAPLAEQTVTRALGELALTMAAIVEKVRAQELRDVAPQLARLKRMAGEMGLVSLSTVADDARICLERADGTAFSAVWARLLRVAERSLANHQGAADLLG